MSDSVRNELPPQLGDYPDMSRQLVSAADNTALTFRIYDLTGDAFPGSLDECYGWLFACSKCGGSHEAG